MLNIIADENIPYVDEFFAHLGTIQKLNGRKLSAKQVVDADILLVRSVTAVNQTLLKGSKVKFVGTATIGTDHLDTHYLQQQDIAWANAPACNAHSVVDYILSCISQVAGLWSGLFAGKTVGIVGLGNVGGRLQQRLAALGVISKAYDPLLSGSHVELNDLSTVLACDVVCLHTPITTTGPYPTFHMLSMAELVLLKADALLINAGRGAVIDNLQLKTFLEQNPKQKVILDVWETEPAVDLSLIPLLTIATPHIAGYSLDGKIAGTEMIYHACCHALQLKPKLLALNADLFPIEIPEDLDDIDALSYAIKIAYDVHSDDKRFRDSLLNVNSSEDAAIKFDELRKYYPERREFSCYQVTNSHRLNIALNELLVAAGFKLAEAST